MTRVEGTWTQSEGGAELLTVYLSVNVLLENIICCSCLKRHQQAKTKTGDVQNKQKEKSRQTNKKQTDKVGTKKTIRRT